MWVQVSAVYYWNTVTQQVSWDLPGGGDVEWVQQKIEGGGAYYWNKSTRQTRWKVPTEPAAEKAARETFIEIDTKSSNVNTAAPESAIDTCFQFHLAQVHVSA
jgi:hypothetical protein